MSKYTIVWNENKTEGVLFRNESGDTAWLDSQHAAGRHSANPVSSLADAFAELYAEEADTHIQDVQIDAELAVSSAEF